MAANWVDILVVCLYIAMIVAIGIYSSKKSKSAKDFLMAGKGFGGIMMAFAYGTTYFSAVIFIGYAGKNGFEFGLGAVLIGITNALIGTFAAWKVLAKRTRRATHHFDVQTMPQMFEKRYNSKHIKLICALIIFIFLTPYAAGVYQGLSYLFSAVFGIEFWAVVLIMASVTAVYVFLGGYAATVLSDFFQGIIMLIGAVVMTIFILNNAGGAGPAFTKIIDDGFGFFPSLLTESGAPKGYTLIMLIGLTSFGTWGMPQMVKKFHTVKSEKAISTATYVSTAFAFVIGVCAYLSGAFARYILPVNPGDPTVGELISGGLENTIMPKVLIEVLPAGLLGLMIILIISASMSTLAALALTGSSSISLDFYKGYIKKDAPEKRINILMRVLCVAFIAVSVVIAILQPAGIIALMSLSWGVLAGCFLAPYFYGMYDKKASKAGAYSGIITGLSVTLILYIVYMALKSAGSIAAGFLSPPAIGVYTMIASMTVMPIVSRLTVPPEKELVDKLFDFFKQKGSEAASTEDKKIKVK